MKVNGPLKHRRHFAPEKTNVAVVRAGHVGKPRAQCTSCPAHREVHAVPAVAEIQLKNTGWTHLPSGRLCPACAAKLASDIPEDAAAKRQQSASNEHLDI